MPKDDFLEVQHLLFDLDDTLIQCNKHFISAREAFLGSMEKFFYGYGIDLKEVDLTQQQIDLAGIDQLGLGKVRFPESLVTTYLLFCEKLGKEPQEFEKKQLEQIGYLVYDQKPELLPNAIEVLKRLNTDQYELHLYTGGDYQIQMNKILDSGLHVHFEEHRRYVSEHKNKEILQGILNRHHWKPHTVWMIGNSARSDIRPALEVGIHAIHIPNENGWVFDQVDLTETNRGRLFVVSSIGEVPNLIEKHLQKCGEGCVGGR